MRVIGIFKSDYDAGQARTALHHRGIGKTELSNHDDAMGGVRVMILTATACADEAEQVMWEKGAVRVEREEELGAPPGQA